MKKYIPPFKSFLKLNQMFVVNFFLLQIQTKSKIKSLCDKIVS